MRRPNQVSLVSAAAVDRNGAREVGERTRRGRARRPYVRMCARR